VVPEQEAKSGFCRPGNASRPKLERDLTRDGWTRWLAGSSSSQAEQDRVVVTRAHGVAFRKRFHWAEDAYRWVGMEP
jgi:hypothetical protein